MTADALGVLTGTPVRRSRWSPTIVSGSASRSSKRMGGIVCNGDATMLGPAKTRYLDQPATVSLKAPVPINDFCRHLEATLDFDFVRE